MIQTDLYVLLPVIIIIAWALMLLLVDLWVPKNRKGITAGLAAFGLAIALGFSLSQSGSTLQGFSGMVVLDPFARFLNVLILGSGLAAIALAYDYLKRMGLERGEYYTLLLISISGMMLMAQAHDLIIVFLALELLSIPLYVLAGFARPRLESEEAALKYFLLGAFASGFVLYGVALIFGATGSTNLESIMGSIGSANPAMLLIGAGLLLVGFGFKVAAVPFHMWAPDVYQGAPTPISGFMSVGVKAAGLAALLRVFIVASPALAADLTPLLYALSILTMLVGNLLALAQTNLKRLLAYSSIANAGYLLMAFVPYGNKAMVAESNAAMLFFLAAYALGSLGAWAVVVSLERAEGRGLELDDYAGLGRKYPWLAIAMLIFMLSFTGAPLTLGFWGKFYLFKVAVDAGFWPLALVGLLTSVISAYYYLRVVVVMYMQAGQPEAQGDRWVTLLAVALAALLVLLSFFPGPLLNFAALAGL